MTANNTDEFDILRNIVEQLKPLQGEDQERILKWACEKLGIKMPSISVIPTINQVTPITATLPSQIGSASVNIKSFVEDKNPQSDLHFAVVVTYFYRFVSTEKKEAITSEDLQEATRLAGRARLKKPSKTLSNAVFAGLLDSAGRGLWKINTVGENLVAIVLPGDPKGNSVVKKKPTKKVAKVKVSLKKK